MTRAFTLSMLAAIAFAGAGCDKLFQKETDKTLDAGDKTGGIILACQAIPKGDIAVEA